MFPLLVYIKLLLFGLLLEEIVVAVKRNIEDEASKRDGHTDDINIVYFCLILKIICGWIKWMMENHS